MGLPFSGEITNWPCDCDQQGTDPTNTGVQYVVSIGGAQGIVGLGDTGAITWSIVDNVIYATLSASAGLGSVTQVAAAIGASANSNLTVSGSPINTNGTLTFGLSGNLQGIAGVVMGADTLMYATGVATFASTPLSAFGRSLIDDAAAPNARSTLGLVIGTNVQAWSADLDSFVTQATWAGANLTLGGGLTVTTNLVASADLSVAGDVTITNDITTVNNITAAGVITGTGSGLTNLNASNLSSGTTAVARGGTGIASYAIGDLIHATGATTLTKLPSVSAGSYLRSAGVTTASVWSTLKLPNAATTGDLLYGSSANNIGNLADVATGNVLLSGGVGVAPAYGKVTSSHVDSTIATISAGINSNITGMGTVAFTGAVTLSSDVAILSTLTDGSAFVGDPNNILTSTGTGVAWSSQIVLDTIRIDSSLSMEATITAGGVTGNQTINKPLGSVNIVAGGSSITVTNSLVDANSCVFCQIATNDSTAIIKNVVASSGQFVIRTTAAVTAETRINFLVVLPT